MPVSAALEPQAPHRNGRIVAIVLAVTVPVLAAAIAAGLLIVPRLVEGEEQGTRTMPTVDIFAAPPVGACYEASYQYLVRELFNGGADVDTRVTCDGEHTLETIAVGSIEGDEYPFPANDSVGILFLECEEAADLFLGAYWPTTHTALILGVPSREAWREGARWYRCDLGATAGPYAAALIPTTGSLRDAPRPATCLNWTYQAGSVSDIVDRDCNQPHRGELAGAFRMPDRLHRQGVPERKAALLDDCLPLVQDFIGRETLDHDLALTVLYPQSSVNLNQAVLCFVVAADEARFFAESLEGLGPRPVPYA